MGISNEVSMFYNAKPLIFERAKQLRSDMTQAEQSVWECLKGKKILGMRFRPQHPMDIFIADFYCHPLKLVIEMMVEFINQKIKKSMLLGEKQNRKNGESRS
jgi:very-short-patch-repair endonuclease